MQEADIHASDTVTGDASSFSGCECRNCEEAAELLDSDAHVANDGNYDTCTMTQVDSKSMSWEVSVHPICLTSPCAPSSIANSSFARARLSSATAPRWTRSVS